MPGKGKRNPDVVRSGARLPEGSRQNLNFLTLSFNIVTKSCNIELPSHEGGENSLFLFFLPYSLKEMKEKAVLMFM